MDAADARAPESPTSGQSSKRLFGAIAGFFDRWFAAMAGADGHADVGARTVRFVTVTIAVLVLVFLTWAALFRLDELTRGQGKIIPSDRVKTVQNLEGGIVSAVYVREGDTVEQGQVVALLDGKSLAADYAETEFRYLHDLAAVARIHAELNGVAPKYPPELKEHPQIRANESAAYAANRDEQLSTLSSLQRLAEQRSQQLGRVQSELPLRMQERQLLSSELDVMRPLVPDVIAKTELLRKERELITIVSAISALEHQAAEAEGALRQVESDRQKTVANYRAKLLKELGERQAEVQTLAPKLAARADKVTRAEVLAPAKGIVKQLFARTAGQVIAPGGALMDIVPVDETLVIEAKISPADAGFIAPGQAVRVKVAAYDFSIYGGLDGHIDTIGADTVQEKDGKEFFYVQVSTRGQLFDKNKKKLDLVPGMACSVDIVTGQKSVLTYLFKPIVRGLSQTFHEK